jgi:glycosyltransferase involved in cell wall biosynthesis
MKILILATDIYTRGGIARYTWTLSSVLGDLLGPDNVRVLSLLNLGGSQEVPTAFRIIGTITDQLTAAGELRFVARALQLARNDYDLIVCNHVATAQAAILIRELYGKPFWVACHDLEVCGYLPFLKRAALRKAELLLPVSRFTASNLGDGEGIDPAKIQVLYNAIPDDFVELLVSDSGPKNPWGARKTRDGKILLSVGSLSQGFEYKGFDLVIRALPQILRETPSVRYVIVGTGEGCDRLQMLAAQLSVAEHIVFAGELSDAELASCYQACDVFVLPSGAADPKGRWHGEGFGRVYAEASLAGKPVVASRVGGAPEAVLDGQTGLLVNPGSPEEVAQAVTALFKEPNLAQALGRAGRKRALENFTSEAMRKSLRGILEPGRLVARNNELARLRSVLVPQYSPNPKSRHCA